MNRQAYIVTQLNAAAVAALPAKSQATAASLLTRLASPVRVGLFGLASAGKRRLLNALAAAPILEADLPLPTLELTSGAAPRTDAMLADGASLSTHGYPNQDLALSEPMFLHIETPAPAVAGRSYLMVVTDSSPADIAAALAWATPRVDVAIWCTRAFTPFEEEIWRAAPDALRNHAVLARDGGTALGTALAENGFQAEFDLSQYGTEALAAHLRATIDEALAEDMDAAEMFLRRLGPFVPDEAPASAPETGPKTGPKTGPEAAVEPDAEPASETGADAGPEPRLDTAQAASNATTSVRPIQPPLADPANAPASPATNTASTMVPLPQGDTPVTRPRSRPILSPEPQVDKAARVALARLFQTLRNATRDLRTALQDDTEGETGLDEIEALLDTLGEDAADDPIEETWPGLGETIAAARDHVVLLRIEAGETRLTDAACLLLHVREEIQERLAA